MKVFSLTLFLGVYGGLFAQSNPPTVEQTLGGAEIVQTIRDATTVQVWRVEERKGQVASGELGSVADDEKTQAADYALMLRVRYGPIGEGAPVDAKSAAAMKALLLAQTSYLWRRDSETGGLLYKGCYFRPIAKVRFSTSVTAVETWLCFSCRDLLVLSSEKAEGGGDFSPVKKELLAWLKQSLPDDTVIAKIR